MLRRICLHVAMISWVVSVLALCTSKPTSEPDKGSTINTPVAQPTKPTKPLKPKPNIWLITVDDMRVDELRYMPNVRSLIGVQGFVWTNAFSTLPLCCPARTSMITGSYAHNHGVLGNDARLHGGYYYFMKHSRPNDTLGVWLQRQGYETALVGKFLNRYGEKNAHEVPPGWSQWRGLPGLQAYSFFNQTWNVNGSIVKMNGHNTPKVTTLSQRLMNNAGGKPFFVWSSYAAPHGSWKVGKDWDYSPDPMLIDAKRDVKLTDVVREYDVSDKPAFLGSQLKPLPADEWQRLREGRMKRARSLIGVDRAIGQTIRQLSDKGLLSNTLIIFNSDNGYSFGEHNIPSGKAWPYEMVTKVPFMMRGPGVPVGRSGVLVGLHDIPATILEASGARTARIQDGLSLLSIARTPNDYLDRPMLFESGNYLGYDPAYGRSAYGTRFFTAIRTQRYVYIKYINGAYEFYDLQTDPHQLDSIKGQPGIRNQLAAKLQQLENCEGAKCNTAFQLK